MKLQVDKMNDKLKMKNETIKDKEAHVINLQTEIENKSAIETKLRAAMEQTSQQTNQTQSQIEMKLKMDLELLDEKNDQLIQECSQLKNER